MGVSHGYQRGPQRWAWDAKAAAAATKKPVCKHRSLSTLPLPRACAAHHCQGPMIQGQLPQENTWHASGWCNIMLASCHCRLAPHPYTSLPPAWVSQTPEAAAPLNPSCLSGTDALRRPTGRGGSKSKAEPQELCEQRRKGKYLPAASGAAD